VVGNQEFFDVVARLKEQLLEDPPPEKVTKVAASQTAPGTHVQVRCLLVVPEGESQNMQWHFPKGRSENWKGDDHRSNVPASCLKIPLSVFRAHPYQERI
jgi:hypothetical protein